MTPPLRLAAPLLAASFAVAACDSDPSASARATDPVVAAHVDVVLRRVAASNAQDWASWEALHTPGAVRTAPELPEPLAGAAAMRAGIEELVQTFPDYHLELVEAFGSRERLVARLHTRATMTGPMPIGSTVVPPTGKVFEQDWVAVLRFEGDRIAAIDEFHDNYGILVQLGLVAAP
jgi:ketosteroid isomerase-like protein